MKKDSLIKMHGASLLMYIQNPNPNSKNQETRVRETLAASLSDDQKRTEWFGFEAAVQRRTRNIS